MLSRSILALAAAAALAVPACALADGPSGGAGRLPICSGDARPAGEGTSPPCAVRICAPGQASTPDVPCLVPCAVGVRPSPDAPCAPVPGTQPPAPKRADGLQSAPAAPAGGDAERPHNGNGNGSDNSFGSLQRKVWRVSGEANGFDAGRHALSIVVDGVSGLSPKLAARLQDALGEQADVLVSARTRVIDADGHRLTGAAAADALDAADSVKVTATLVPRKAWASDQDGTPVPAMRALRVKIVS
jgi:hypothetical protein